jgi:hypothetical protein
MAYQGYDDIKLNEEFQNKKLIFSSGVVMATGSAQTISHGLGVIPSHVIFAAVDTTSVAGSYFIVEGAHDATDIKFTATLAVRVKILAFA